MKRLKKSIIACLCIFCMQLIDFLPAATIYANVSDEVEHNIVVLYADGHKEYRSITDSSLTSTWDLILAILGEGLGIAGIVACFLLGGGWIIMLIFGAIAIFGIVMFFYNLTDASNRISTMADQALEAGLPAVIDRAIIENLVGNNDHPIPHDSTTVVTTPTKLPTVFLQHGQQLLGGAQVNKWVDNRYVNFNNAFNFNKQYGNSKEKPIIISTNHPTSLSF